MWWHKGDGTASNDPPTESERLVQECEAFLEGHWANALDAFGQPIPPLAWLNLLAHGSIRDITAASHWSASHSVVDMTARILRVASSEEVLRELQWEALVPLELELLGSKEAASLDTQMLQRSVLDAVESFRHESEP
jgi:hypothetical protein